MYQVINLRARVLFHIYNSSSSQGDCATWFTSKQPRGHAALINCPVCWERYNILWVLLTGSMICVCLCLSVCVSVCHCMSVCVCVLQCLSERAHLHTGPHVWVWMHMCHSVFMQATDINTSRGTHSCPVPCFSGVKTWSGLWDALCWVTSF